MRQASCAGIPGALCEALGHQPWKAEFGAAFRCAATGKEVLLTPGQQPGSGWDRVVQVVPGFAPTAMAAFPVTASGALEGSLECIHVDGEPFDVEELNFLRAGALALGMALEMHTEGEGPLFAPAGVGAGRQDELFFHAPDPHFWLVEGASGAILLENLNLSAERCLAFLGAVRLGEDVAMCLAGNGGQALAEAAQLCLREERPRRVQVRLGEWVVEFHLAPLPLEPGRPRRLLALGRDVTGFVAAERTLLKQFQELEHLKSALHQSAIVSYTSREGVIQRVNARFEALSGYSQEEIEGKTFRVLKSGYHPPDFYRDMWETLNRGQVWHGEVCNRAKNGQRYWVDSTLVPQLDASGTPEGFIAIRFDITPQKRLEQSLREAKNVLLLAMEHIPGAFAVYDEEDRLTQCNNQFLGLLPPELRPRAMGSTFGTLMRGFANQGNLKAVPEEVIAARFAAHRTHEGSFLYEMADGRVLRAMEQPLPGGGLVTLTLDITEDVARERELARAREAAESAVRTKDQFIACMNHELRTPLNAVLGFTELLAMGPAGALNDKQAHLVESIVQNGRHLLRIINDLLELARFEDGHPSLELDAVDLGEAAGRVMRTLTPLAQRRGIQIHARLTEATAWADRQRLEQVLLNLGSNGIKYNQPGGTLTFRLVQASGGWHRLEIEDEGLGIPVSKQSEVFQPFNRLGRELGEVEGTGLGLNLARRMVDLMGGRIGFTSLENVGSTFWIELPPPP